MAFNQQIWSAGDDLDDDDDGHDERRDRRAMGPRPALWLPKSRLKAIEDSLDANGGVPQTAEEYIVSVRREAAVAPAWVEAVVDSPSSQHCLRDPTTQPSPARARPTITPWMQQTLNEFKAAKRTVEAYREAHEDDPLPKMPKPGNAGGWYQLVSGRPLGKRSKQSSPAKTSDASPNAKRSKPDDTAVTPATISKDSLAPTDEQQHAATPSQVASIAQAPGTNAALNAEVTTGVDSTSMTDDHPNRDATAVPSATDSAMDQSLAASLPEQDIAQGEKDAIASNVVESTVCTATTEALQESNNSETSTLGQNPDVSLIARFSQRTVMALLANLINWMSASNVPPWLARWQYAMLTCLDRDLMAATAASSLRRLHRRLDHVMNHEDCDEASKVHGCLMQLIIGRYYHQHDMFERSMTMAHWQQHLENSVSSQAE